VAVRIRMSRFGRKHRPFFRIVAADSRSPRDGKYIEALGSYDPMIRDKDQRVILKPSRIKHWLSVGALPSEKVAILFKKYMDKFEKLESEATVPETPPPPA
jgi:small subunit ribosomal protein S16